MKERRAEVIDRFSIKVQLWYQYLLILSVLVVMIMKARRGDQQARQQETEFLIEVSALRGSYKGHCVQVCHTEGRE
jgi:hypothetical protein